MEEKVLEEYEFYLYIFWKCVKKSECIFICKILIKIDYLSEGNIIKGVGLFIDIYLIFVEESIYW